MSRCTKPEGCDCLTLGAARMFCEHMNGEHPAGEMEALGIANWKRIDPATRRLCADHLRMVIGDHPAVLERWRDQKRRGIAPGSDDVRFHFSGGMAVRNVLRQVLLDHRLPGPEAERNWDDFYMGAIDEIASESGAADPQPRRPSLLARAWGYWLRATRPS